MKTMILLPAALLLLGAAPAPTPAPAAPADKPAVSAALLSGKVVVLLKSGAKLHVELLRTRPDNSLVVDLGSQTVTLPAAEVLQVSADDTDGKNAAESNGQALYTRSKSDHRPEPGPASAVAERVGDSVVMVRTPRGLGSGFFISRQGYLLTNYHVVEQETQISLEIHTQGKDGGKRKQTLKKIRLVALNPLRDLALLQMDLEEAKAAGYTPEPLVLSGVDDLQKGDQVIAIGNPLGLERSVTQGIASSTNRNMGNLRLIQTDVAINPGNSGGPLINNRGELVGVACAGATGFNGLAFGIPVEDVVQFLDHQETFLYDQNQPQNGVKYLEPPGGSALADHK